MKRSIRTEILRCYELSDAKEATNYQILSLAILFSIVKQLIQTQVWVVQRPPHSAIYVPKHYLETSNSMPKKGLSR